MKRFMCCGLLALSFCVGAVPRQTSEPTVSGPAQENPKQPTGKSYKKDSKRKPIKNDNPSTGQTRRLGNTGHLTNKDSTNNSNKDSNSKPQQH